MCSVTARTYSWKTICWAGVGQTTSAQPAQMRRPPGGPARIADILPQQKGFEAELGRLEIMERIFPRAAQVTNGFVFDRWDIDRGEVALSASGAPVGWHRAGRF